MRYLINSSHDPYYNMAFDEFSLQGLDVDEPVFYVWQNEPSVIIGLNQNAYGEVNIPYLNSHGIHLVRRVTGGGAVYHDLENINYTIVGRSQSLETDYPGYMNYMVDALRQLGVPAELSGRNDILVEGRKVSGYAKRVWHDRLMVHGTLMYDVNLQELTNALAVPGSKLESAGIASVRSRVANLKDYLPSLKSVGELMTALTRILSRGYADAEIVLTGEQLASIRKEADEKFRTWEWTYGKSKEARFSEKKKFKCGTVETEFSVDHGVISELVFRGDFLGNLPVESLAAKLEGCRYDRASIAAVLKEQPVGKYFDGLTDSELTSLLLGD